VTPSSAGGSSEIATATMSASAAGRSDAVVTSISRAMLTEEIRCRLRKLYPVLNHFLIQPIHTDGMTTLELRPNIAPTPTVEELIHRIAELVLERQSLRAHGIDSGLLEQNRIDLVRAHQDLSVALIARHCPPKADAA
jgi:hypothetical protein